MPFIAEKRVVEELEVEIPQPKKAKKDPIAAKVEMITDALQAENFEVAGSSTNRQMLVALAPTILSTPRDLRHSHQEQLGGMVTEVFEKEEARLQTQVAETQTKVDGVNAEFGVRRAAVEAAEAKLQAKGSQLKDNQVTLSADVGVTRNAEATVKETAEELTSLDETKTEHALAHEEALNVKNEGFTSLKEGTCDDSNVEKDHVKALVKFFKKIKADASLVAALPMALARKQAELSDFDSLAAVELEKLLESKIAVLAEQLKTTADALVQKVASKEAADAALDAAKKKQRVGAEAMLATKAEQKQLAADLSEKQEAVLEHQFETKSLQASHNERMVLLTFHQGLQTTLTELLERRTPVAEAPTEVPVPEEVVA